MAMKCNNKKTGILLFVTYFSVVLFIMAKYALNGVVPMAQDGLLFVNMLDYVKDTISSGEFPFWNSLLSNGISYVADITMMSFYPLRYAVLVFPLQWMFPVFYAIHLSLGAVFTYNYLLSIKCDRRIAILTSILYLFSIHLGGARKEHITLIASIVYLPMILYYIEKYLENSRIRYLLISSLCMALQFFVGFPQYALYTDLFVGLYLIIRGAFGRKKLRLLVRDSMLWGFCYLGLILAQFLPFIQMTKYFVSAGAETNLSYDVFKSLSIHPFRYIMMLFPQMFDGVLQEASANLGTSGLDIEVFLGTFVISVVLCGVCCYWRNKRIRGSAVVMIVTGLYASNGNIPALSRILYKVPLLNMFRVPSRILFIFIFFAYVVFAMTLSEILKKKDVKKLRLVILFIVLASVGLMVVEGVCLMNKSMNLNLIIQEFLHVFMKPILILLLFYLLLTLAERLNCKKWMIYCFLMMFLINIIEVFPYWNTSSTTSISYIRAGSDQERQLIEDAEGYKVLVAASNFGGTESSMLGYNRGLSMGIKTIDSYINMNNPKLSKLMTSEAVLEPSYNFSGLFTGFPQINHDIEAKNDLLSMLGVKYIIDHEEVWDDENYVYDIDGEIGEADGIDESFIINTTRKSIPIHIEPETFYEISFEASSPTDVSIIGSFYSDSMELDTASSFHLGISPVTTNYKATVFSGHFDHGVDCYLLLYIRDNEEKELAVNNFQVHEFQGERTKGVYKLYYSDDSVKIYENENACQVLYVPGFVQKVDDVNAIYDNSLGYDLKKGSYCVDIKESYINNENVKITNICENANGVSADILTQEKVFINYSQNYFPGWRAYIDGKETNIYEVNGLIQGIEVPQGEHVIEFIYVPVWAYIGILGSVATLIIMVLLIWRELQHEKKNL